jgi:hypothetical protein
MNDLRIFQQQVPVQDSTKMMLLGSTTITSSGVVARAGTSPATAMRIVANRRRLPDDGDCPCFLP